MFSLITLLQIGDKFFIKLKNEAAGDYYKVKESFDELYSKRRAMGLKDIVITETKHDGKEGKRVLIDAFLIATVRERDEFTFIKLNKEATGDYYKVKESFDEVHKLKKQAMGFGMNENCM